MTKLITETSKQNRQHKREIVKMFKAAKESVDIASAYVTNTELLKGISINNIRLLTGLSAGDIIAGATSLEALRWLIKEGVEIRIVSHSPKFHPKVYLVDKRHAIVSSANLTHNAMENNIEIGVALDEKESKELSVWFDKNWGVATPLSDDILDSLKGFSLEVKKELDELNHKKRELDKLLNQKLLSPKEPHFLTLDDGERNFFICNSDRKNGLKTESGSFLHEETMLSRGAAMAWETFSYTEHMERAINGDIVFLFAKGKGIIAIGEVKARVRIIPNESVDKQYCPDVREAEWRIDIDWLTQRDDLYAFKLDSPPQCTFIDISATKYKDVRKGVLSFFSEVGTP